MSRCWPWSRGDGAGSTGKPVPEPPAGSPGDLAHELGSGRGDPLAGDGQGSLPGQIIDGLIAYARIGTGRPPGALTPGGGRTGRPESDPVGNTGGGSRHAGRAV